LRRFGRGPGGGCRLDGLRVRRTAYAASWPTPQRRVVARHGPTTLPYAPESRKPPGCRDDLQCQSGPYSWFDPARNWAIISRRPPWTGFTGLLAGGKGKNQWLTVGSSSRGTPGFA
jgi:hypothetical protein